MSSFRTPVRHNDSVQSSAETCVASKINDETLTVESLGCRLNALEGDEIRAAAQEAKLTNAIIINSCSVTKEAVRQTRQKIRRAARTHPMRPVLVTGCAVHSDHDQLVGMPEVARIIGNLEKRITRTYRANAPRVMVGDIMASSVPPPQARAPQSTRIRATVEIQTGCDHRCTFCVIPQGRGNSRSVASEMVIARIRDLVALGHQEIVLTGVDITSWGVDLDGATLGDLIARILREVPELPRLRLSSVDAIELDPHLLDMIIGEPRLMPHLHLSLQSGDNIILKRMARRHSREQAIAFCAYLRAQRPDIVFGADLIAGFPTETNAMFENSRQLIDACGLTWLHVFSFSARPGTPAARMPQVAATTIAERARALRTAGADARRTWLRAQIGQKMQALVEGGCRARSPHFAQIELATVAPRGQIIDVQITAHDDHQLFATRLQ